MGLGSTALRATIGPLFIGHGAQKLFGWFGGHGPEATAGAFESMGLRPGKRQAISAGAAEAVGGVLLTLGLLTPVAASMISGVMITAIRKVHASKGPWVTEGGFEYNAVVLAAMLAITDRGPGKASIDQALMPRMRGAGLALAQLAAGAAGSWLATGALNEPPAQEQPGAPQASSRGQAQAVGAQAGS